MHRKLALTALGSSLLMVALVAPAATAAPAVALEVNAIPGVAIEICDGGVEVHSRQRYANISIWGSIDPPLQTWTIRKAAPGKCKGKKLGSFSHTFEPDKRYTVVYWRPGSTVKAKIAEIDPSLPGVGLSTLTVHHVAKAKKIDAYVWQQVPGPAAAPTVSDIAKGTATAPIAVIPSSVFVDVFPVKRTKKWKSAGGGVDDVEVGTVYQAFFMGTKQGNMSVKILAIPGPA